jgi:hypothetical protein
MLHFRSCRYETVGRTRQIVNEREKKSQGLNPENETVIAGMNEADKFVFVHDGFSSGQGSNTVRTGKFIAGIEVRVIPDDPGQDMRRLFFWIAKSNAEIRRSFHGARFFRSTTRSRYSLEVRGMFFAFSKKLLMSKACCRLHSAFGVRFTQDA